MPAAAQRLENDAGDTGIEPRSGTPTVTENAPGCQSRAILATGTENAGDLRGRINLEAS